LFPVVNFLKYVVTEVLFSVVIQDIDISRGNIATHLRCDEIVSDNNNNNNNHDDIYCAFIYRASHMREFTVVHLGQSRS